IHICLYDDSKDSKNDSLDDIDKVLSKNETIAFFTAKKISELIGNTTASTCQYKPGDIALLFRSYSRQNVYEKYLRQLGISYTSESITNFFGDAPINDIYALLRLVVYPQDVAAYAAVLRSPFIRISPAGLTACLLAVKKTSEGNKNKNTILFTNEHGANLCGADAKKYSDGLERYDTLCDKASNLSCTQLLSFLWYNEGYRFECAWNLEVSLFSELYDYLFELARTIDQDGGGLSAFIEQLAELKDQENRLEDMDIPLEREGAVHLMSIHKSKGLEFPVVFVCAVNDSGGRDTNNSLAFYDEKNGMSLNFPVPVTIKDGKKNWFYYSMSKIQNQKASAELRRLLYVASTRAEKELYITGHYSLKEGTQTENLEEVLALLMKKHTSDSKKQKDDTFLTEIQYGITNNKMFSFLLPVLLQFCNTEIPPVTLEPIERLSRRSLLEEQAKMHKKSAGLNVKEVQKISKPLYEQAEIVQTPKIENMYRSPSQLKVEPQKEISNVNVVALNKDDSNYSDLDRIINTVADFDYTDFGTFAHAYVEAAFTGQTVKNNPKISSQLSTKQLTIVQKSAREMTKSFMVSALGMAAKKAMWKKTEYAFKMLVRKNEKKIIVNGSIDLVFEKKNGGFVLLDFKTDKIVSPNIHLVQLAAYRRAMAQMRNSPVEHIECWLFYLRNGQAVNVSEECAQVDLEKAIFLSPMSQDHSH
ncbi:MAG TPA: 3'-5' exonuclease, partial [Treponemataceae bacterium]|nr:3'-5' exonuclease [Treponemataceae bacterium]